MEHCPFMLVRAILDWNADYNIWSMLSQRILGNIALTYAGRSRLTLTYRLDVRIYVSLHIMYIMYLDIFLLKYENFITNMSHEMIKVNI